MEEKFDHETQGMPGSSQDDMTSTPQTLKRVRQDSPSPETASTRAVADSTAPTSSRKLADKMKPVRKRRNAGERGNLARKQQQEQEQASDQDE